MSYAVYDVSLAAGGCAAAGAGDGATGEFIIVKGDDAAEGGDVYDGAGDEEEIEVLPNRLRISSWLDFWLAGGLDVDASVGALDPKIWRSKS